jgi:hypothetical protein
MPASLARIDTPRAGRYLSQLCEHLGHMLQRPGRHGAGSGHDGPPPVLDIDRTDDQAVITFAWGSCTLRATDSALLVRVEATDDAALGQAEALLAHRIQTIGHRELLTITWQRDPLASTP